MMSSTAQGMLQTTTQQMAINTETMSGYHIIAIRFSGARGPLHSGIALVPSDCSDSVDKWENWSFHNPDHVAPNLVQYRSYHVTDAHDETGLSMKGAIRDAEYLVHSPVRDYHSPARVLVMRQHARLLEKLLYKVKPLYDENAMLAADSDAIAMGKPPMFESGLFGTYADQVKERVSGMTYGFYNWQALGSFYGPVPKDQLLQLKITKREDMEGVSVDLSDESTDGGQVEDDQMMD